MDLNLYRGESLEGVSYTTETFKKMCKLRVLLLRSVNITGSFNQKFENLRILVWDCCPLTCLPSEFHPQKLVVLVLLHSQIRKMWEPNMVKIVSTFLA